MDFLGIRERILTAEDPVAATREWLGYALIYAQVADDEQLTGHLAAVTEVLDGQDAFRLCSQAAHVVVHTFPADAVLEMQRADGSPVSPDDLDDDGDTAWVFAFGSVCVRGDDQAAMKMYNARLIGARHRPQTYDRLLDMARAMARGHLGLDGR